MNKEITKEHIIEIKELMNHVKQKFDNGYLKSAEAYANEMSLLTFTVVMDILDYPINEESLEKVLESSELFSRYVMGDEITFDEFLVGLFRKLEIIDET